MKAAETHLAGLALLLSARRLKGGTYTERNDVDGSEELTDSLAIFISALHSRVSLVKKPSVAAEMIGIIRNWQKPNVSDLLGRLSLLRFIPAFLLPPPSTIDLRQLVDVSEILAATRVVTQDRDNTFASGRYIGMEIAEVWRNGAALPLLFQMTNAHTSMPTQCGKSGSCPPIFSTLSGMLAAVELYLGTVLRMLDVGWAPFTELGPYTLGVLVRDLGHSRVSVDGLDVSRRDLWFWKAFIAWASLACLHHHDGAVEALLHEWIRDWSEISGVRDWEDAKNVLRRVAWPEIIDQGSRFEALWKDIAVD
ncbi:hypothetical protein V498_09788 [Pseudogymnoascus sp. VKM F-4517 (FW-2822)]|nr:hypothetical protein V498_09788 [Pseudogymnoascus sp. VKM F-4517 (FW-2822)]